jgi:hypothetical protein
MGTEAFWVPAVLAAVSGGAQYANASNAASRANNAEAQSIADQAQFRNQANGQVQQLTKQIANNQPNVLADQDKTAFVNTLRANAAGSTQGGNVAPGSTNFGQAVSALPVGTVGSSRYKAGNAAAQQEVEQFGNTNAAQLANVDAPVRQRQFEGLDMQSLGTNLNTLGLESHTQNFVDQLRAQQAGQQNPWVSLFSNIAGNLANYGSKNWGGSTPTSAGAVLGNGTVTGYSPTAVNPGAVGGFNTNYWDTSP